jgi:hypothetical protein
MRIWFSLLRMFGIRPGFSFSLSELTRKPSRKRGGHTPEPEPAPEPEPHVRVISWVILALAGYGLFSMVGCAINAASAGTCRYYSDGMDSVESCDNGSFAVTDPHCKRHQYGEENGGFEGYPGQPPRPVYRRREGD